MASEGPSNTLSPHLALVMRWGAWSVMSAFPSTHLYLQETETEVNSDLFQSLVFPNEPLKVYAREPYIRRVQLPTEKEPRRIFARRLSHLAEEISGLLPPGKV